MAVDELAAKVAADSAARMKLSDDETLLAAEAFAFGVWEKYVEAKVNDINKRINERFGTTGSATSGATPASPSDLGKPAT